MQNLWVDPLNVPQGVTLNVAIIKAAQDGKLQGLPTFTVCTAPSDTYLIRLDEKGVVLHVPVTSETIQQLIIEFLIRWK